MHDKQTNSLSEEKIRKLEDQIKTFSIQEQAIRKKYRNRQKFEELLTKLSIVFVKIPVNKIDKKVEEVLRRIGEMLGFDRVEFAQGEHKEHPLEITHSWTVPGAKRYPRTQADKYYPWFTEKIRKGESFHFITTKLAQKAPTDSQSLEHMGIKSGLIIPYLAQRSYYGAICFGSHAHHQNIWTEKYSRRLKLLAEVIINALLRKNTELKLHKAFTEIKSLKNQLQQENIYLREEIEIIKKHGEIIGESDEIKAVLKKIQYVAKTDTTVLILGETGTGKELVARAIHEMSQRKKRTMVTVNCAALPAALIEGELFGREKGAYTGATSRQIGRFETASGSSIFLDEIGELPLELQVKLLRVLQQGEIERLGSTKTININVRVIAATNRDLKKEITNGNFREDLYYRLDVYPIHIPALRERTQDILPLTWAFVKEFSETMGKRIDTISRSTLESVKSHSWPGNVRELRNVVERSMIACKGRSLNLEVPQTGENQSAPNLTLEEHQRRYILKTLKKTGWQIRGKKGAAKILGLKPTTLYSRMKKLGIKRPE